MTSLPPEPRPVPLRRYRYSKLRWRIAVHLLDAVGGVLARAWRWFRPIRPLGPPRKVLVVQLDHLGDAVLSSPLFPRLRAAYPSATIDVLASPSNRAVFEANPHVDRVRLASRSWFERQPGRRALISAVWELGRSLRGSGYDLGLDVRGDVLTVLMLTLAGIPRRVGWAMGGGGFLLTDVARWDPTRHEVAARLALLDRLGLPTPGPARVSVHVTDSHRARVARLLRLAWPEDRLPPPTRASRDWETQEPCLTQEEFRGRYVIDPRPAGVCLPPPLRGRVGVGGPTDQDEPARSPDFPKANLSAWATPHPGPPPQGGREEESHPAAASGTSVEDAPPDADQLHAGRFGAEAPLLAVHLGAGTAAKRWPPRHWKTLLGRFLADGWRVVVVGGPDDVEAARTLEPHRNLRDWTGRLAVTETTALLERADLFLGADSGPAHLAACAGTPSVILFSGTNRVHQWRPWSRRALVLKHPVPCRPCHHKTCPLADHPCMTGLDPDRVYHSARRWWARLHRSESPHAPV